MFKNYFKTGLRNLWRHKNFTFINISGLAVGISVCLVIFLVIRFELSFDQFHSKKDRIHRVLTELHGEDGTHSTSGVPFPLPTYMHNDFASLKSTGVYSNGNDQIIIPDDRGQTIKKFKEERGFFFAEPTFFEIFDYPLLAGDYKLLKDPYTAIVTKQTAEKYFGDWKSAIGRSFKRNGKDLFRIIGVLAPPPENSDFQIRVVASYASVKMLTMSDDWNSVSSNHACYVLLPAGTAPGAINAQFKTFVKKYKKDNAVRDGQYLEPLSEVHYATDLSNFLGRTISKRLINTLWLIAAFILLIACVNFINLATAQAINRSREVGVRKVLGSNRQQLRLQFYSETALITFAAVVISLLITYLTLPLISKILELPLKLNFQHNPILLLFLASVMIAVIFLAGFYPAIVLSRFNPVTALKSKVVMRRAKGLSLRRALVVFQFVIAQALIIGTLIIVKQMDYFRTRPLGFDKEAIINVSFPDDSIGRSKIDFLRNKLEDIPGIQSVTFSYASPADNGNWYSNFRYDHAEKEVDWAANLKWGDVNYLKTYNLELVAGRNLQPSDTVREFIVNENLLGRLGIRSPKEALNKQIEMWDKMRGPIVGVIRDFNAINLKEAMPPVIISTAKDFYAKAGIKMQTGKIASVLPQVEKLWNQVYPDFVYEQKFLDVKIANFYAQERKLSILYKMFAAIAIFLSCLGLYGLASFMAVQRVKEVGIRKVLGASVTNIILLFSKEFMVLIGIAFLIAAPLALYYMHDWLQDFVYRIHISLWIPAIAGILACVIALLTISFKALSAAMANPVKNLRTE
jgi:putative ABC transport system permease protein